jgi:hypothetical protein
MGHVPYMYYFLHAGVFQLVGRLSAPMPLEGERVIVNASMLSHPLRRFTRIPYTLAEADPCTNRQSRAKH